MDAAEKIGLEQNWVSEPEVLDFREQSQLFESFGVVFGSIIHIDRQR